jgi:HSP20 family protein
MGFRRTPGDPSGGPLEQAIESSLRQLVFGRPAQPAIEETEFPAIDVFETATDVVIEAEVPGVSPESIAVIASEGLIVIEGDKHEDPGPGRVTFVCMERSFGPFRRVVLPGAAVDISRATAVCRDGLLQVRVPKVEEKRGRIRVVPVTAAQRGGRSEP